MQLRSFRAQGFKNLRQPVTLEDLGPINVLHGPNNVGKSNLLHAMALFFFLAGERDGGGVPIASFVQLGDEYLAQNGFPRNEIFNLEAPAPIQLEAEVAISPEDFEQAGLSPGALALDRIRLALELRWTGASCMYTIRRFVLADGKDLTAEDRSRAENATISGLSSLLRNNLRISRAPARRFARIDTQRITHEMALALALVLYDTKESADIQDSRRWDRFVEAMAAFNDILGEGVFIATYDRKAGHATLFFQTPRARIPLHLLGSGVQQLASLLGSLLVVGSTIAGVEEPELNLRYTLQLRLREVLSSLVGVPGGLDQLFLTSHSDAFEAGAHFYQMEPTPDGPRMERRRVEEARVALGMTGEGGLPDPNAVLCYLSTEGVVRVPERIRRTIGLPNGGGVVFLERDGGVEMMSDEAFADRFEPERDGEGDEQP